MTYRKKLIEVALPLGAINAASAREKAIRHGHPSTLHLWWARRPLAACRAVLFAQLVDDPSSWPEYFSGRSEQDDERERLFQILEQLVKWESTTDEDVLVSARREIARSYGRSRVSSGSTEKTDVEAADGGLTSKDLHLYLATVVPPVHDPFAGGGSIPLEAQRLGLRAVATDLNPIAALINRALIQIPPPLANSAPVGPVPTGAKQTKWLQATWPGATGLAEDVRRYGRWMRERALQQIGHLYPEVDLPADEGGGRTKVIAWIWARTVFSPNPAFHGIRIPLVSSFWLSKKKSRRTWVVPAVGKDRRSYAFEIRTGPSGPELESTVGRSGGHCILSGDPIPLSYIRSEAKAGRLDARLMAVAVEGKRKRVYLEPTEDSEALARSASPIWAPSTMLPKQALGFRIQGYGLLTHKSLFTARQLVALSTFTELVPKVREDVLQRGLAAGREEARAEEYADAVATYVSLGVGRSADYWSTIATWHSGAKMEALRNTFARHAIPMTWDFAEANPFSNSSGNFLNNVNWVSRALRTVPAMQPAGTAAVADAPEPTGESGFVVSTDPPYYDNVPYADLSDFFYVWLRQCLRDIHPDLFGTLLVPKAQELVAEPFRHGGRDEARRHFESGMFDTLRRMRIEGARDVPLTVFYAFKQSETVAEGTSSTGWETFLNAVITAGFSIVGTWPVRTELGNRLRNLGSNALASSIVLVCRQRAAGAATINRARFRRLLRADLPEALEQLEKSNIAPVDMSQATIGPGMAIFSGFASVLEPDDRPMSLTSALRLINEVVDEVRGEEEGEFDSETRFAVTWFETHGTASGQFGEAEVLATARAVSVEGVAEAGICRSAGGKVQLLSRAELPADWTPAQDDRPTVWEATQHLIQRLDSEGELGAALLLRQISADSRLAPSLESVRQLAYRLYTVCERKGWAEEAGAYNRLVIAWPELARLSTSRPTAKASVQEELL